MFTDKEWLRYTRHLQLGQVGAQGQSKLKNSHVLIVGCGGLGCPAALYLAAAGVGKITLVDSDVVDLTNLQRQVAFSEEQLGCNKAVSLQEKLHALNSDICVVAITDDLTIDNADTLLSAVDLVLDCTDNFATRYVINDVCFRKRLPWVMASIAQFSGQCSLFVPDGACFRCVFPESPQGVLNCSEGGVLGVLPGMLSMMQANEALKYLVGLPTPLKNCLLLVDALDVTQHKIALTKNKACVCCGDIALSTQTLHLTCADSYTRECDTGDRSEYDVSVAEFVSLKQDTELQSAGMKSTKVQIIDVRSHDERQGFHLGGLHVPLTAIQDASSDRLVSGQIASGHITKGSDVVFVHECGSGFNVELNSDSPYVIYCQSGKRSLEAVNLLRSMGLNNVKHLAGGVLAFLKAQPSIDVDWFLGG